MEGRRNTVLTDLGRTKEYEVKNGLDQEGTMSLILWRIYYDPLIAKIDRDFKEFTMSVNTPDKREYKTNISVITYIGDSLWIADTKKQLEEILEMALSFYKMSSI